jgi:hypothetical protein
LSPNKDHPVRLTGVEIGYPHTPNQRFLNSGDPLSIRIDFDVFMATDDVAFVLEMRDEESNLIIRIDTDLLGQRFELVAGAGSVRITIDAIPMLDGTFDIDVGAQSRGGVLYDWWQPAAKFEVMNPTRNTGFMALATRVELLPEASTRVVEGRPA